MRDQLKRLTEFGMQRVWLVTHHRQATAFFRSILSKGSDDYVATRSYCTHYLFYIGVTVSGICQKMEYRSVVPNIVAMWREYRSVNVIHQPVHAVSARTPKRLRAIAMASADRSSTLKST